MANILTLKNDFLNYKKNPSHNMLQQINKVMEMVHNLESVGEVVDDTTPFLFSLTRFLLNTELLKLLLSPMHI